MGIIVLEIFTIIYMCSKLNRKKIDIKTIVLCALLVQSLILILYRIELLWLNREIYYSDAEDYWIATLKVLNGDVLSDGRQMGYIMWSVLIQKLSPFVMAIWNNISNMLLTNIAILMIADIMSDNEAIKEKVKFFLYTTMFNPLIIYSLFRNLKDALFLCMSVVIIYSLNKFKEKKKIRYAIISIVIDILITDIRPWGFLIIIFAILGIYYNQIIKQKNKIKKSMIFFIAIILLIVSYVVIVKSGLMSHVVVWWPIIKNELNIGNLFGLIIGMISILVGPGWYRSINGDIYFSYYTNVGNIACLVGSVIWWFMLAYFISKFKIKKITVSGCGLAFFMFFSFMLLVYSAYNDSNVELRFRGVMYILGTACFMLNIKDNKIMHITSNMICYLIIMFVMGTIMSI